METPAERRANNSHGLLEYFIPNKSPIVAPVLTRGYLSRKMGSQGYNKERILANITQNNTLRQI